MPHQSKYAGRYGIRLHKPIMSINNLLQGMQYVINMLRLTAIVAVIITPLTAGAVRIRFLHFFLSILHSSF